MTEIEMVVYGHKDGAVVTPTDATAACLAPNHGIDTSAHGRADGRCDSRRRSWQSAGGD